MTKSNQDPPVLKNLSRTARQAELDGCRAYQAAKNPKDFRYYWVFYDWVKGLGVDPNKKGILSRLNQLLEDFKKVNGEAPKAPRTKGKARSEVFGNAKKDLGPETYEELIRLANVALKGEISALEASIAEDTNRLKSLKSKLKKAGDR